METSWKTYKLEAEHQWCCCSHQWNQERQSRFVHGLNTRNLFAFCRLDNQDQLSKSWNLKLSVMESFEPSGWKCDIKWSYWRHIPVSWTQNVLSGYCYDDFSEMVLEFTGSFKQKLLNYLNSSVKTYSRQYLRSCYAWYCWHSGVDMLFLPFLLLWKLYYQPIGCFTPFATWQTHEDEDHNQVGWVTSPVWVSETEVNLGLQDKQNCLTRRRNTCASFYRQTSIQPAAGCVGAVETWKIDPE